jgi:purine-nucleoside phosphorylase
VIVVMLSDHINLLGDNPLVGPNLDELGPRFPDMSRRTMRGCRSSPARGAGAAGAAAARRLRAVAGPNLETRAEYRMLRRSARTFVGMSTVPEVIVARHMGMRVLGGEHHHRRVPARRAGADGHRHDHRVAAAAEPVLARLLSGVLERID